MGKSKFAWITKRKRSEPEAEYETPVWLGNKSNGEFFHFQTERERKMRDEILRRCDDNARKLGMDRREFMASSMGMLTTLSVFNLAAGCGDKNGFMSTPAVNQFMAGQGGGIAPGSAGAGGVATPAEASSGRGVAGAAQMPSMPGAAGQGGSPMAGMNGDGARGQMPPNAGMGGMGGGKSGSGGRMDGGYMVPNEACMDQALADRLLKQDYFIMDVQTHHADGPTIFSCINGDCGKKAYVKAVFQDSETTVAVLSGLPGSGATSGVTGGDVQGTFGVSNETLYTTRDQVNMAAATQRMIAHCQVTPNATPAANSAMMEKVYREHKTKGWKCYPPAEGGWFLTDPNALMFIQKAMELGEPLICAHKGFPFPGWSVKHADPGPDVGKVAAMFPNVNFVIYHSACAFEGTTAEGMGFWNPGDPVDSQNGGTSRLAKVVFEAGLTNKNVYAEMGSVWNLLMNDPMLSQHYVGKMLKYVGQERLVWGTESIWLGAPQPQIAAFKMFKIADEIRDKYGYPDFTDLVKRQVFGLTSAGLYGINPGACYTNFKGDAIAQYRKEADEEWGEGRFAQFRPVMTRYSDFILHGKQRKASGAPDA
ncbi:MAG TPA: amidohydrolase family protein [Polyangiales bacterium]|nr:amidohydrolase family protein [Polyangiales bacterium]